MDSLTSIPPFKAVDANPGGTLKRFDEYIDQMQLLFELAFRKADGTASEPTEREKKALTRLKGGADMKTLFEHVGEVVAEDTFEQAVTKIRTKLTGRTNKTVQRNMLLCSNPRSSKTFEKWSQEIAEAAKLISYEGYNWKSAAVDAILLQTSNKKLRERALQEEITYEELIKLGIAKEQSHRGAALLEQAAGHTPQSDVHEEVRRLKIENNHLKKERRNDDGHNPCSRCARRGCTGGKECSAMGKSCSKCGRPNHFAVACRSDSKSKGARSKRQRGNRNVRKLDTDEESSTDDDSELSARVVVGKLSTNKKLLAKVSIQGFHQAGTPQNINFITDTGISKTLINIEEWHKIRSM